MMGNRNIPDPPEGWAYVDAVTLLKCIDEKGNVRYRELMTETLPAVEALGMATTFIDTLRRTIMDGSR